MTFIKHTPPMRFCRDQEHNPPTHMVLPAGSHTWECPTCGQYTTITTPEITM